MCVIVLGFSCHPPALRMTFVDNDDDDDGDGATGVQTNFVSIIKLYQKYYKKYLN